MAAFFSARAVPSAMPRRSLRAPGGRGGGPGGRQKKKQIRLLCAHVLGGGGGGKFHVAFSADTASFRHGQRVCDGLSPAVDAHVPNGCAAPWASSALPGIHLVVPRIRTMHPGFFSLARHMPRNRDGNIGCATGSARPSREVVLAKGLAWRPGISVDSTACRPLLRRDALRRVIGP